MNKTKRRYDTREEVRKLVRSHNQLVSSHKSVLEIMRGQINELGILRKYILELRAHQLARDPGYDRYRDYRDGLLSTAERNKNTTGMSSSR